MTKLAFLVLRIALAAGVLWLITDRFDRDQFAMLVSNPVLVIAPAGCWLANQILTSIRAHFMLQRVGYCIPYINMLRAHMSSLFLGSVLPGVVGADVIKGAYLVGYNQSFSKTRIASVLLVDRLLGVGSIVAWSAFFALLAGVVTGVGGRMMIIVPVSFLAAGLIGFAALRLAAERFTPAHWPSILQLAWRVLGDVTDFRNLGYALIILGANFAAVLVLLLGVAGVGAAIHFETTGEAHFLTQVFLLSITLLATAVPITPLGIGIGQITASSLYALYGLDPSVGVTVSTVQQLSLLLVSVAVGGPFLLSQPKSESGKRAEGAAES